MTGLPTEALPRSSRTQAALRCAEGDSLAVGRDGASIGESRNSTDLFGDPLATPEVGLVLSAITFPRAGVSACQVKCAGSVIYERRVVVEEVG